MAEYPPLGKSFVLSYSNNDRDFPIVAIRKDPRVDNYRIPEDLSPHPDSKRWPNHVFTGAQPTNSDERVQWIYEILPSPWVPFTRYDDDLGPVQGRRRSVKNEGQVASLAADKRTTYEAREGSAIVYTELEETWSIATDDDGNSLFPIRDRDFYDPSRGPVQERRQLFVPTGEEEGSLENVNGVITQISYEPYNEFLSVKIVQTYKVNGPKLVGYTTDNDGTVVRVTTQRKAAKEYIPPQNLATQTLEVSREDAESLVERISNINEIFKSQALSVERQDPLPQKFRVASATKTTSENVVGEVAKSLTLSEGQIAKSEQQVNRFVKRTSETTRNLTLPVSLSQVQTNENQQLVNVTESVQEGDTQEVPTAKTTVSSEALGDGTFLIRKEEIPNVFSAKTFRKTKDDLTPAKFRASQEDLTKEETIEGKANENLLLSKNEFSKSEQQLTEFIKRVSTTSRSVVDSSTITESILTNDGQVATRVLTLADGQQTIVPTARTIDANIEALGDGRTVKTETIVPNVFAGKSVVKTKIDLTPEKFRAKEQELTIEESLAGTINPNIELSSGEYRKSEQQITEFIKRISSTSRDTSYSSDLKETVVTPQGQIATRSLRLSSEPQSIQPDELLIDGSIEELGDGRTIKTEVKVPNVFANKSIQKTKTDLTPQKFRANQEDVITEETVAGTIDPNITLSVGEFSKSEQQITEFTKRISTNTRDTQTTSNLTETIVTPAGQIATRTLTLSSQGQSISPDALLVDGSIEALGDGRTIKTETRTSSVFPSESKTIQVQDNIPAKFRALIPTRTSEISLSGEIEDPELAADELSKSEQQVTQFIKRVSTTKRNIPSTRTLLGRVYTSELGGGLALVEETYPAQQAGSVPEFGTVSDEIENLGDGRLIRRKVKLDTVSTPITEIEFDGNFSTTNLETLPVLKGQEYDQELDITIPFKQLVVKPSDTALSEGNRKRVTPRDVAHSTVIRYDIEDAQNSLDEYYLEVPDMINVSLPDKLLSIQALANGSKAQSDAPTISGDTYSYSKSARSSVGATISYKIEQGFSGVVPTVRAIFFLPKGGASPDDVLNRVRNERNDSSIEFWPNARPEATQIAIVETSNFEEESSSVSFDSAATSTSSGSTVNTNIANVPPTIHGQLTINIVGNIATGSGSITINPSVLDATNFTKFPTGWFLYQINSAPYRFSYVRVDALLVNISNEYV